MENNASKTVIAALLKAKKQFNKIVKGTSNPFYKSKYADLSTIISAVEESLSDNGIVVIQYVDSDREVPGLRTILAHESGEQIQCGCIPLLVADNMQHLGSAITYARRYGLQSALMLTAEDDDANSTLPKDDQIGNMPQAVADWFRGRDYSRQKVIDQCQALGWDWRKIENWQFVATEPAP